MQDYSEAPLTPIEIEAVRSGATLVRHDGTEFGKIKSILEACASMFGITYPGDDEIRAYIEKFHETDPSQHEALVEEFLAKHKK